jgi:AraC-like DNA-binding protein
MIVLKSHAEKTGTVEKSYSIELPNGKVDSKTWHIDGFKIVHGQFFLKSNTSIDLKNANDNIHLHFNLKGSSAVAFKNSMQKFQYNQLEHNIAYSNCTEGIVSLNDLYIEKFIIEINKDEFLKITDNSTDALMKFGDKVLKGETTSVSKSNHVIDLKMYNSIQAILNCNLPSRLKKIFLTSKCMEMLALQADCFETDKAKKTGFYLSKYDKECLLFSRNYMIEHIEDPPSLIELAVLTGINLYKLKRGFKEMFGTTVFDFLSEYRLGLAMQWIVTGEKTIKAVADELGYSSLSHFSNAFKKKFGVSPKQIK